MTKEQLKYAKQEARETGMDEWLYYPDYVIQNIADTTAQKKDLLDYLTYNY